jgi:hypothetical protein
MLHEGTAGEFTAKQLFRVDRERYAAANPYCESPMIGPKCLGLAATWCVIIFLGAVQSDAPDNRKQE